MSATFQDRITRYSQRVEGCLDAALPPASTAPTRLHEAMRYSVMDGGKRVRPLLVYASGECLGVETELLDAPAVAIELIHAFSLIHDDLPAMDDDELRRGKATLHVAYDEATAILAADALQPLAFAVLSRLEGAPAPAKIRLVKLIADACGSIGMTGGQSMDLAAEGHSLDAPALERMYSLKTGALIHASIMAPSLLCENLPADRRRALDEYGRSIGIAFQIKDDVLDVEGDTHVIGKPAGSDQRLRKATYPGLFGLEKSRQRCNELLEHALQQLRTLGDDAAPLDWLARFIVERTQ